MNALAATDRLTPFDFSPLTAERQAFTGPKTVDLRSTLFTAALVLLLLDTMLSLWLGGYLARRARGRQAPGVALVLMGIVLAGLSPGPAQAQTRDGSRFDAALVTRLAYVITGDAGIDATSRAGLTGLSQELANRTAMNPGEPMGVDLARDELAFYPLLYFPIAANRPVPVPAAIARLDAYMKAGGTVLIDTRDATSRAGAPSAEAQFLRRMLATLDIPELEPVPRNHVLTKTFYLLESFVGRYASSPTWVEALPPAREGEVRPARAGDGVSPLIITGNDLAASWAVGPRGEPLFPVLGSDPRQREMAFRGGVNIVMYTLTGNYKADQVHVPALLERLGQ